MEIGSSSLRLHLSLMRIDELKPHEEVIESGVRSLAEEMLVQGEVRDPLMVDQDAHVVLDGMHRFSALASLKCRFAPCCLFDYDSEKINVGAWFRLFVVDNEDRLAEDLLKASSLPYSKRQVTRDISYDLQTIVMTRNGMIFSLPNDWDPVQKARTGILLEKELVKRGLAVDYLSEIVAVQKLRSGEVNLVISLPIFTKKQIRECGVQGKLLPHKVTRHVIPSRPLGINVPLSLLRDPSISLPEADLKLNELLKRKNKILKPPGSVVEGRRYQEELLLFA